MRSRPAHISQTTASTTSRRALPANKKDPHGGPRRRLPLDKPPLHISSSWVSESQAFGHEQGAPSRTCLPAGLLAFLAFRLIPGISQPEDAWINVGEGAL